MVTTNRQREVIPLLPGRYSDEQNGSTASESKKFILVVEDDMRALRLERFILEDSGYLVTAAGSGEEALEILKKSCPSLVLLDIGLPDMDGFATCERIRGISPVPIIMVTAKGSLEDKVRGLEAGADDYVTKPFMTHELATRVKVLLRRVEPDYLPPRRNGAIAAAPASTPAEAGPPERLQQQEGSRGSPPNSAHPLEDTAEAAKKIPPASGEDLEDLYEGTVKLAVETDGYAKEVINFVSQLRQNPQLRLLRLVASQHREGMDIWLGLREPMPLKLLLSKIEGVAAVNTLPDTTEEGERLLAVSLKR